MICSISKTEQLKEAILRDIKSGGYKPGDALPAIQELCRKHGLSKHTVSQALSNLAELGYIETSPGRATRVMATATETVVAALYPGRTPLNRQPFWAEVHAGATDALFAKNARCEEISLGARGFDAQSLDKSHGALLLGSVQEEIVERLERASIPYVSIYCDPGVGTASVSCDMRKAVERIFGLFSAHGAKRIGYIDRFRFDDGQRLNALKHELVLKCAAEKGVELVYRPANQTLAEAYSSSSDLLRESAVDALLLSTDFIAQGVYRAIHEAGLRIPFDLELASFDDLELASYMTPSLSSVDLRRKEAGEKAAGKLLSILAGEELNEPHERFEARLILRESTPNEI